ncbi:ATP-binding protein [Salinivibrio sp. HTSP]|uniref:ATP-binding protein n=1 Tax=Salinivibrio sp. HTSP TaxID=2115977 RepID=UPI0013902CCC|nr:ATP-binding protein [Salinivibrio sp. HTSP]
MRVGVSMRMGVIFIWLISAVSFAADYQHDPRKESPRQQEIASQKTVSQETEIIRINTIEHDEPVRNNTDAKEIDLWLVLVIIFTVVFLGGIALRFKRLMKDKNDIEAALITSRKKAEEETEIKANFLATMSHEIRTPIHGIIGMLDQIAMTPLNFEQKQMLAVTSSSASMLYNIVSEVLDYSKLEAGKLTIELRPFVLRELIDNVLLVSGHEARKKNLSVELHIEPNLAAVYVGDEYRLRQILINIVSNAVKFTHKGRVLITLEVVHEDDDKQVLKIGAQDSGVGMSQEELERVFHPFSQAETSTTRRFGGTGLGLTISRQLIELMAGEMIVESEKGQGSWVGFTVPLVISARRKTDPYLNGLQVNVGVGDPILNASLTTHLLSLGVEISDKASVFRFSDDDDEKADVQLAPLSGMVGVRRYKNRWLLNSQPIMNRSVRLVCYELLGLEEDTGTQSVYEAVLPVRILVVEDNDVNQTLVAHQLNQLGVLFDIADNGNDALSFLTQKDYAFVLCDCHMPYMDGYQFTEHTRAQPVIYRDIPIIAMTADVLPAQRTRCLEVGMNDFLSKPIPFQELRDLFRRWGVVDNNGLDIEALKTAFGKADVLEEMLNATVKSLVAELDTPVAALERAEWVHKQAGTVALLGLTSLAEFGTYAEITLRDNVEHQVYREFRSRLFLVTRQIECMINEQR